MAKQSLAQLQAQLDEANARCAAAEKRAEAAKRPRSYVSMFPNDAHEQDANQPAWRGSLRLIDAEGEPFWHDLSMWETDPTRFSDEAESIPDFKISSRPTSPEYAATLEERHQEYLRRKAAQS